MSNNLRSVIEDSAKGGTEKIVMSSKAEGLKSSDLTSTSIVDYSQ